MTKTLDGGPGNGIAWLNGIMVFLHFGPGPLVIFWPGQKQKWSERPGGKILMVPGTGSKMRKFGYAKG